MRHNGVVPSPSFLQYKTKSSLHNHHHQHNQYQHHDHHYYHLLAKKALVISRTGPLPVEILWLSVLLGFPQKLPNLAKDMFFFDIWFSWMSNVWSTECLLRLTYLSIVHLSESLLMWTPAFDLFSVRIDRLFNTFYLMEEGTCCMKSESFAETSEKTEWGFWRLTSSSSKPGCARGLDALGTDIVNILENSDGSSLLYIQKSFNIRPTLFQ